MTNIKQTLFNYKVTPPQWKSYLNRNEVITYGVTAGSGVYVGGGDYSKTETGPALLEGNSCNYPYRGLSYVLSNCVYLVNQRGNFEWIPSRDGISEKGAVLYGGFPVGRAQHSTVGMRVGKISKETKSILYTFGTREYRAYSYDALVFKPYRL
jgi:hypothetical protein